MEEQLDREKTARKMCTSVPRCIASFVVKMTVKPEPWDASNLATWKLMCPCGAEEGAFLGYPLRHYNEEYKGTAFIGPLGFECAKCKTILEILDTNHHGYHADACSSPSHICGDGPRERFACPGCGRNHFGIVTSFFYWEASIDLVEDEPEEFFERAQDLFCEFVAHGWCDKCHAFVRFTDFGKF
jgi:hypothetical protein